MTSALSYADEASGLSRGSLKAVRAALDAALLKHDPKGEKAKKQHYARKANNYILEAPTHVLARELLRRVMDVKKKVDAAERQRLRRLRKTA